MLNVLQKVGSSSKKSGSQTQKDQMVGFDLAVVLAEHVNIEIVFLSHGDINLTSSWLYEKVL